MVSFFFELRRVPHVSEIYRCIYNLLYHTCEKTVGVYIRLCHMYQSMKVMYETIVFYWYLPLQFTQYRQFSPNVSVMNWRKDTEMLYHLCQLMLGVYKVQYHLSWTTTVEYSSPSFHPANSFECVVAPASVESLGSGRRTDKFPTSFRGWWRTMFNEFSQSIPLRWFSHHSSEAWMMGDLQQETCQVAMAIVKRVCSVIAFGNY